MVLLVHRTGRSRKLRVRGSPDDARGRVPCVPGGEGEAVTPEGQVKAACLELLAIYRLPHGRLNTIGGIKFGKGFIRGNKLGTPDIWCNLPPHGRCLWIETKSPRGVQTDEQTRFQQ